MTQHPCSKARCGASSKKPPQNAPRVRRFRGRRPVSACGASSSTQRTGRDILLCVDMRGEASEEIRKSICWVCLPVAITPSELKDQGAVVAPAPKKQKACVVSAPARELDSKSSEDLQTQLLTPVSRCQRDRVYVAGRGTSLRPKLQQKIA